MAFYDRPDDPRFGDPLIDQRTGSRFDGAALWFLVALIVVITAAALFYPGPSRPVVTNTTNSL